MAAPSININVNLGNATQQIDAFGLALSRVDQKARGIFNTLQNLSQQYQREGFLGPGDQRRMEQATQRWHRAGELLDLQRRGAMARFQDVQARFTGTPADQLRLMSAATALHRLQSHSTARAYLQQQLSMGVLAGQVPASPLQAAQMAANLPVTPFAAGRFSRWAPPTAAPGWAGWTGMMPPSGGGGGGWGAWTSMMPPSGGGGGGWGAWTSMMPATPWWQRAQAWMGHLAGQVPGALGTGLGMAYQGAHAIARPAMQLGGALMGVGIYGTLTQAMDLYRQRAQGVIAVGMQLDTNFQGVGHSIDTLRDRYQILAHDSIAAMSAFGRVTGGQNAGALDAALRMGTAYGMAPADAAGLAGALQMRTAGANPLARAFAGARAAYGRGGLPMAGGALAAETATIAAWGGPSLAPMLADDPGRWVGFLAGMGQRYREPGAAAGAFAEIAGGITQAQDPTTLALRMRSLEDLRQRRVAQGLGNRLTIGQGEGALTVDLSTLTGKRMAMENALGSPEILQGYLRSSQEMFGANPEQRLLGFHQFYLGGQGTLTQAQRLLQRGGMPAGLGTAAPLTAETREETERLVARVRAPEFQTQLTEAMMQAGLEGLGKPLVDASNELKKALIGLTDIMKDGQFNWDALVKALGSLQGTFGYLAGTLVMLGSNSASGQMLGLGMLGLAAGGTMADVAMGIGRGVGNAAERFRLADPNWFSPDPGYGIGGSLVQPQRPSR